MVHERAQTGRGSAGTGSDSVYGFVRGSATWNPGRIPASEGMTNEAQQLWVAATFPPCGLETRFGRGPTLQWSGRLRTPSPGSFPRRAPGRAFHPLDVTLDCTQAKRNNSVYIPLGSYIISASQLKTPKRAIRVQVPSSASLSTKLPVVVPASGSSLCSLMLKPKALVPGNTIGIVAPASTVDPEAFVKGVAELQSGGYKVRYSDSIFARERYFAGPHEERANELMRFFRDPTIDGIFCARGGYGCQHLLSHLDAATIQTNPKVFVGYSDVTVLLQYLENQCGMVCFHGPMVAREFALGEPFYNRRNFVQCTTSLQPGLRLTASGLETLQPGTARGRLTGGCLSLLTATLGTNYEIQTENKILFLEDVNAKPYQIDRMLMHLKLAGKLSRLRGVVFGEMLDCVQSPDQSYRLQEVLVSILTEYRFPILYGLPSGHTTTGALTLPFGIEAILNADEQYLELLEAAVQ